MSRTLAAALVTSLGLAACTTDVVINDGISSAVVTDLDRDFDLAEAETGVPADLLKAIGYSETRWQMVAGEVEHDGAPTGIGVMDLRPDQAARGAALAGTGTEEVGGYALANIEAAAYLLAEEARAQGVAGYDLMQWAPVVAAWSGIADEEARNAYVQDGVFRVLREGAREQAESGDLVANLSAHRELPSFATGGISYASTADYGNAVWRPSSNFGARPSGTAVSMVVIHSCEGNYAGCWGWLKNPQAQASAHYVVNESGSEVTQLVREGSRAWHVAATYACARAGNTQCGKNGVSVNNFAIGIEHAGFGSQASWSNGIIETSARLTCDITRDHGIARDRNHIVSHGQLQPWDRTDPGRNWPWAHYIDRVRDICGDGGGGTGGGTPTPPSTNQIIVDSNNANNNASVARIELAGTWTSASATPGYYGSGYWWGNTAGNAAPATFFFYLPSAQSRTVEAWWTAGTNRAMKATFVASNAAGTVLGSSIKNQQTEGSQWVTLGTYSFSAGWNKVALNRQGSGNSVVIADAVRVR